ncbi:phosphopyruvate hydratase [Candidatus Woesearchaeota archaeon]|nr:phosphopyruvate hydratase [Candidatus Woesearchaeota archaeon]
MDDIITEVKAIQVLDSRGNPTLKVTVKTGKHSGSAMIPSGASTGVHEALELRDKGKSYHGKSVNKPVDNVNKIIAKHLKGWSVLDQAAIDSELIRLDGTENKSRLGANAILGVSLAVSRVAAQLKGKELYEHIAEIFGNKNPIVLPIPQANVINGGEHAGNFLKIQEFMLVPLGAKTFAQAAQMISETYHTLRKIIDDKYGRNAVNVGDEGGFAPPMRTGEEALDAINEAIARSGYKRKIRIGLDVAASAIYHEGQYDIGVNFTPGGLISYYERLLNKYDIRTIEDPFGEDDLKPWAEFMATVAKRKRLQVVADDLTVSNNSRVEMAIREHLANALLLKVNQIGTLTEAMKAAKTAMDAGWQVVVSHRSGETEDPYIADLAVGIGASQIKLGAPCRSERVAKYNRLIEIESGMKKSSYAGKKLRI